MRAAVRAPGIVAVAAIVALAVGCGQDQPRAMRRGPPHVDRERASLAAMRATQPGFRMLEGEVSLAGRAGAARRGTFFSERSLNTAIAAAAASNEVRLRRVDCVAGRRAADHREFFCGIVFVDGSEGQAIARVSLDGRRWRLGPMRLE